MGWYRLSQCRSRHRARLPTVLVSCRFPYRSLALVVLPALVACGGGDDKPGAAELMDPETCKDCHPKHYREWQGSMHAYAAEDPVFLAMNERGQRETNGELGDFCIRCHAPVAVATGETEDGLNIQDLPQKMRGVTCYACHNVTSVEGTHNNPLVLGMDTIMRGGIDDPEESPVHDTEYSALLDSDQLPSADMCGSCHDIMTTTGVHLEQTYLEWQESFFADRDEFTGGPAVYARTCGAPGCHLPVQEDVVADFDGVPLRLRHMHGFAGVDVQLTPWPDPDTALELVEEQLDEIAINRRGVVCASLCVQPQEEGAQETEVNVWMHNETAGHNWPSGATQDRRAWVQLVAQSEGDVVFESGRVADGEAVAHAAEQDPQLVVLRGYIYGDSGEEVHMFWEATRKEDDVLTVPPVAGNRYDTETWRSTTYMVPATGIDHIQMELKLRPMGLEVLQDLVDSGDLDPSVPAQMRTFDIPPAAIEWTPDTAETTPNGALCVSSQPKCSCITAGTC